MGQQTLEETRNCNEQVPSFSLNEQRNEYYMSSQNMIQHQKRKDQEILTKCYQNQAKQQNSLSNNDDDDEMLTPWETPRSKDEIEFSTYFENPYIPQINDQVQPDSKQINNYVLSDDSPSFRTLSKNFIHQPTCEKRFLMHRTINMSPKDSPNRTEDHSLPDFLPNISEKPKEQSSKRQSVSPLFILISNASNSKGLSLLSRKEQLQKGLSNANLRSSIQQKMNTTSSCKNIRYTSPLQREQIIQFSQYKKIDDSKRITFQNQHQLTTLPIKKFQDASISTSDHFPSNNSHFSAYANKTTNGIFSSVGHRIPPNFQPISSESYISGYLATNKIQRHPMTIQDIGDNSQRPPSTMHNIWENEYYTKNEKQQKCTNITPINIHVLEANRRKRMAQQKEKISFQTHIQRNQSADKLNSSQKFNRTRCESGHTIYSAQNITSISYSDKIIEPQIHINESFHKMSSCSTILKHRHQLQLKRQKQEQEFKEKTLHFIHQNNQ